MIDELRQRLRAAKAAEGLGYHRLGRKVGVDKMVLQRFLKGTTVPNGLHLERIRAYLDGAETVPEDETTARWLYAAAFGSHVKVGVSHRPQDRLVSLRQASPHRPVLLGKRRLVNPASLQEERDAHEALAPWHHRCRVVRGLRGAPERTPRHRPPRRGCFMRRLTVGGVAVDWSAAMAAVLGVHGAQVHGLDEEGRGFWVELDSHDVPSGTLACIWVRDGHWVCDFEGGPFGEGKGSTPDKAIRAAVTSGSGRLWRERRAA